MNDEEKDRFIADASRLLHAQEKRDRFLLLGILMMGVGLTVCGAALIYGLWILDVNDIPSKFVHFLEARI